MNAATTVVLMVVCALVSCAAAAEDAQQSMGKTQSAECLESTNAVTDCRLKLGAGPDAADYCSACEQVLSKYYEDCDVSPESYGCSANAGAATPASVSAISVATATLFALQALL